MSAQRLMTPASFCTSEYMGSNGKSWTQPAHTQCQKPPFQAAGSFKWLICRVTGHFLSTLQQRHLLNVSCVHIQTALCSCRQWFMQRCMLQLCQSPHGRAGSLGSGTDEACSITWSGACNSTEGCAQKTTGQVSSSQI